MTREFDVYLDGKGYMLGRRADGQLLSGAAREQVVDPFTQYLSRDEPWARVPFRFGDGAGLSAYDGSNRYEWGNYVDARSGSLVLAPVLSNSGGPWHDRVVDSGSALVAEAIDTTGAQHAIAERWQCPAGVTHVRNVALLWKRDPTVDYTTSAVIFRVAIAVDAAGPTPGASIGFAQPTIRAELDLFSPFLDRWRNDDWFWYEVTFAAGLAVTAGNWYWTLIYNNQNPTLHWAEDQNLGTVATRSVYNGAVWSNGAADYPMMYKLGFQYNASAYFPDSFVRCFQVFRGLDDVERLYCGDGYRVKVYGTSSGANTWAEANSVGVPVLQMLEFDNLLFVALGPTTDLYYHDGTSAVLGWTQLAGEQANAFAVHDNMLWKADYHVVEGCLTGLVWGHGTVDVGDPGTPVQAMVSHGGKLYCSKPEGLYEISYPDTYPTSGNPTCNLVLDFSTERCPRTWLLDWHSGLYFPGLGGVYELKSGVLRNIWTDKVDEGAVDVQPSPEVERFPGGDTPYRRPRSWAPLYDEGPVAWTSAHGTTRGIVFARSNPHTETSDLLWYDGRNWFSLWASGETDTDGGPDESGEYVTAVFVQDLGGGRGRMWWNRGFAIDWCEWPTWTKATYDDGTVEYNRYGQVTTPWFSLGQHTKEMLLYKVGVVSRNLSGTVTVDVSYRLDDDASWTALGTCDTSPYEELEFAAGTTARRVQFKLELDNANSTSNTSATVEQMDLLYQPLSEQSKTHQLILQVADLVERKNGTPDRTRTAGDLEVALTGLADDPTAFTYEDVWGVQHTVRAMAVTVQPMRLIEKTGPLGYRLEGQALVSLLEV